MRYVPVKDHKAVRDTSSGAILFTDEGAIKQAGIRRRLRDQEIEKSKSIERLNSELESMKRMMNDLIENMKRGQISANT